MRISDWSSDVCSSDLLFSGPPRHGPTDDLPHIMGAEGFGAVGRHCLCGNSHRSVEAVLFRKFLRADYRGRRAAGGRAGRSEEHTSELQSLMRISYAVFCLKKNNNNVLQLENLQ